MGILTNNKYTISIVIIWLFNVSGVIGILIGYEDWFLGLTPLHLSIYIALIIWNAGISKNLIIALLIPFVIGMFVEFLGVNYGLIFGDYQYGKNLGYSILGVPWMIGVNWAILVYCTAAIAQKIHKNILVASMLSAVLMVALDVIIEVSAPRFDFWEFEAAVVPLQNYIGWFCTAMIAQLLFQKVIKRLHYNISIQIFIAILIFFSTFLFF